MNLALFNLIFQRDSDRVFIIAGGPSVSTIDLNLLKGEDIICINRSIELFDRAKAFVTMDYTFFEKVPAKFNIFKDKVDHSFFVLNTCNPKRFIQDKDGIIKDKVCNLAYANLNNFSQVICSPVKDQLNESLNEFGNGENSGFCAVQLALLAGYKEINLIGFDLGNTDLKNKTHYHDGYKGNSSFKRKSQDFTNIFLNAISKMKDKDRIRTITPSPLEKHIKRVDINKALLCYKNNKRKRLEEFRLRQIKKSEKLEELRLKRKETLKSISKQKAEIKNKNNTKDLIIVGYYTKDTPYEEEAKKLKSSIIKLGLKHDVVGVDDLGNWQMNTQFKAKFLSLMLNKHKGKNLLYIDCDAVIYDKPELLLDNDFDYDIAVRWQDFKWRKNECLSGTIYLANNIKTHTLCKKWATKNIKYHHQKANNLEQWNLGEVITEMRDTHLLKDFNLPPEYTMIFDSMRKMYPNKNPVIEHFQASRKFKK